LYTLEHQGRKIISNIAWAKNNSNHVLAFEFWQIRRQR
jgi:hypothetical protein